MVAAEESDLRKVAEWLLLQTEKHQVVLLDAPMGAGKTTLIKEICRQMDVQEDVTSPTYSLVNEYLSPKYGPVYHFDLYRLEKESEAIEIGIEDYLFSDNYCFIEWPEKIRNFLPPQHAHLTIDVQGDARIFKLNLLPHE